MKFYIYNSTIDVVDAVVRCTACWVKVMLVEKSFGDFESMGSGISSRLQPSERLHEFSLHSESFSSVDVRYALKLCMMSCVVLRLRTEEFFAAALCRACAMSHQSDATPDVAVETSGRRLLRRGRRPRECLLSVHSRSTRRVVEQCFPFRPARLIDNTSWTHLAAAHKTFLYLFAFGRRCANVSLLCVDGALFTGMTDLCTHHHARTLSDVGSSMAAGSFKLLELCSWFVRAECCDHVTHNGLKWPLKDEIGNHQMMMYMWAMIQSCRSTTASLAEYRERWIACRLEFELEPSCHRTRAFSSKRSDEETSHARTSDATDTIDVGSNAMSLCRAR